MDWLGNHFILRKNAGSCLLILNEFHINSPDKWLSTMTLIFFACPAYNTLFSTT